MHHEFEHMNEQGGEEVRKETQRKKKKTIHNKRNIYLFTIILSSFFRPPPFPFPSLSNPRQASRQHRSKMRTRRLWMSLNPSPNSGEKLLGRARNLGTSSRRTFKSILPLGETKGPGPARISLPRSAGLRLPFLRTNRRLRAAYPRESLPRGGGGGYEAAAACIRGNSSVVADRSTRGRRGFYTGLREFRGRLSGQLL